MIRRTLLLALRRVERWNHAFHRAVGNLFPRRYKRVGECARCGRCCEAPNLRVPRLLLRLRPLLTLWLRWQRLANGFEFSALHPELAQVEFRCLRFDPVTRLCREYDLRPIHCREHPAIETWLARPRFLEGCAYRAESAADGATRDLLRALAERGEVDPEASERFERRIAERERRERLAGE